MLSTVDILIVLVFLGAVALAGNILWKSRGVEEYFLGGRNLPWPAVTASIVATETSTLTFIGAPALSFAGDLTFLQLAAGYIVGRIAVARLLLPGYFGGKYSTAYEVLSERLGEGTRRFASLVFMVTRMLADGVRLYASALVVSVVLGTGIMTSIALISVITLLYSLRGGLVAVVWTDLIQLVVYLGGAVYSLLLLVYLVPGGLGTILSEAASSGKLRIVDTALFSAEPFTLAAGLAGGAFLSMASHGTDHLMVQRLMAAGDERKAGRALISSGFFVFFQFALFLLIGLSLYAFYRRSGAFVGKPDEVFPFFIVNELPSGARGIIVAAVLASAVSTLSSSVNSLASSTYGDLIEPIRSGPPGPRWRGAGC